MLHWLQVTIDLNKNEAKISKDINSFPSKVEKRKIVEVKW